MSKQETKKASYRHELKHEINYGDMLAVKQRLSAVMKNDIHAVNGNYSVHSLYFDNAYDKALKEKINGVNNREKFRIRYYNNDTSFIRLEKKVKVNNLCSKESAALSFEQAQAIAGKNYEWMPDSNVALVQELYSKIIGQGLYPKTVVEYSRTPFVFEFGNVRVTLDYNIRTGANCADFFNLNCVTVPVSEAPIILEIKWDEYLPDIIREAVQLPSCRAGAFSKYAACRIYG